MQSTRLLLKKTSCKVNMVYTVLTSCQKMLIIIQMHAYKANNYVQDLLSVVKLHVHCMVS